MVWIKSGTPGRAQELVYGIGKVSRNGVTMGISGWIFIGAG